MEITALEELSKTRVKVFVDDEFAFVLYKGELRFYGIVVGEPLEQETYQSILQELLPKRAKLRVMNLLKSREYTTKQLYDKLKAGLYPEKVITEALEYVQGFRYIDDLRYAVSYITDHERTRGRRRMEQDLLKRGINRETLKLAWEQWEEQGGSQDETSMVLKLLEKRGYCPGEGNRSEYQRNYAYLVRKGFSHETIRKVLRADFEEML